MPAGDPMVRRRRVVVSIAFLLKDFLIDRTVRSLRLRPFLYEALLVARSRLRSVQGRSARFHRLLHSSRGLEEWRRRDLG